MLYLLITATNRSDLLRRDEDLADAVQEIDEEIARRWPARSYWIGLPELRFMLLRGELPPMPKVEDARSARLTLSPASLRTLCRAALDRGERLDPRRLARQLTPPAAGSLMAASIAAIDGAHAAHDGNDIGAASRWAISLGTAVQHDYLLLACDALEALAAMAGRQGRLADAGILLASAESAREITGYRFRFGFEQAAVEELRASMPPAGQHADADAPSGDAQEWKTTAALALLVAREVIGLGADCHDNEAGRSAPRQTAC